MLPPPHLLVLISLYWVRFIVIEAHYFTYLFFMEHSEFFLSILATVAKVDRVMGGLALGAVVIDV